MQFSLVQFWWIPLVGIVLAVFILILAYWRVKGEVSSRTKFILIFLRTLAIGLLLICLLEPILVAREEVFPGANLMVAFDTSQSMSIKDVPVLSSSSESGEEKITRIEAIAQLLSSKTNGFWEKLTEKFDVHLYSFNSECKKIENSDISSTQPNLTDIGNAISTVAKDWRGQPTAGLILLTDGNHNVGNTPIAISKNIDIPIYTVGVGNENPPKDIKISKVRVEPVVYVGHKFPIEVMLESNSYYGEKVQIQLLREGSIIDVDTITLAQNQPTQSVRFEIYSEDEGNFRYEVSISELPDELTYKNNQRTFFVKSIKAKLRVFYIDSRPRWEYKFLKRTLERDANIDAVCEIFSEKSNEQLSNTLLTKTDKYYPQTGKVEENKKFPSSSSELNFYDVLIFGDISPDIFSDLQKQQIRDFVEKRGKALIFLGGKNSLGRNGFVNSELKELLPIMTSRNSAMEKNIDFNPSLTYEGLHHPITRLENLPSSNRKAWHELPPLSRFYAGLKLKAGTTVLAEYNPHAEQSQGEPIITFQRYGAGKTLLIAADDLWSWAFSPEGVQSETGVLYYSKFWAQTIRWMSTRSDAKLVNLETDKQIYNLGDEVKISVYVYDESYSPLNNADLEISLLYPENERFEIKPVPDEMIDGLYTTRLKSNQKGSYKITATASYAGAKLGSDSIEIVAEAPILEFENPQQNIKLLKQIAEITEGEYLPISQYQSLPELIKYEVEPVTITHERTLWDNPIILVMAIVILGVEWILRKQKGLV